MKKLLPLFLGMTLAGTAGAQTTTDRDILDLGIQPSQMPTEITIPKSQAAQAAPMADNTKLSYYTDASTGFGWQAPLQVNEQLAVLRYGQRFTMPGDGGTLDSIRIRFSQAAGDTIFVLIMKDSLYTLQGGAAHAMDISSPNSVFGGVAIPVNLLQQVAVDGWVTIQFPGLELPKEFHIVVAPRIISDGQTLTPTSTFTLVGENTTGTTPTTESMRSNFLALTSQGLVPAPMDNFFQVNQQSVAVNFHMDAWVASEVGSVARPNVAPAAMYPNPATNDGMLKIEHSELISSIRIVNILGNEVQSWSGLSNAVELSTAGLAKGVYSVVVNTEDGVTTEKLVVE